MRNEKIAVPAGGTTRGAVAAKEMVLPDIRCLGLCVGDPVMSGVLIWSYDSATITLNNILKRQRWSCVTEPFEIDVPDLSQVATQFPRGDRSLILDFWAKYHAVVKHFMPDAVERVYYYENNVRGGVRYHGMAWYTKGNVPPSLFDKDE